MPLTLRIVSKQKSLLGADSIRVFSVHGGSIGRGPDNDWILPDPNRYLSGRHAVVDYRGGAYYLTDTSTNGVYVNDSDQPIGKGTPLRLYDGDRLRMGDYLFDTQVVNVSASGEDDSGVFVVTEEEMAASAAKSAAPSPAPAVARGLSMELTGGDDVAPTLDYVADDASMDLDDASLTDMSLSHMSIERGSPKETPWVDSDQSMDEGWTGSEHSVPGNPGAFDVADHDHGSTFGDISEDISGGDDEALFDPSAIAGPGDTRAAVELVARAIGIDPNGVPDGAERAFLTTVGRLVRQTVDGLVHTLRQRALVKAHFRLSQTTIQPTGNNPIKFAPDLDHALSLLFTATDPKYLPPSEALHEALRDVKNHQSAVIKAMRAAFDNLLERFDPENLEARFNKGLKRGSLLGVTNKSKYWDLYRDFYQLTALHSDDNFPEIVGKTFADTYEAEMDGEGGEEDKPERKKPARKPTKVES